MDWDAISHFAVFASTLICTGSAIFMVVMRSSFASKDAVTNLSTRVTIIEQVASPEWLREVSRRLRGVEQKLEGLDSTLKAVKEAQEHNRESLDSIQQYLLEHDR